MTVEAKAAIGFSVGLHALLLGGLPLTQPPTFDIERAPTSVELYFVEPPPAAHAESVETAETLPPKEEPPAVQQPAVDSQPQTVVSDERKGAEVDMLPSYLRNPPPAYPPLARQRGYEGTVLLDVEVLASGRCGQVDVLSSSGHSMLDEAAVSAVRRWVFRPAKRWQGPVAFHVEIPITFRLVDAAAY